MKFFILEILIDHFYTPVICENSILKGREKSGQKAPRILRVSPVIYTGEFGHFLVFLRRWFGVAGELFLVSVEKNYKKSILYGLYIKYKSIERYIKFTKNLKIVKKLKISKNRQN